MQETEKRSVLFLCTSNSCRSQMAEGWLRHLAGSQVESYSAGLEPQDVDPLAIQVMAEVGIDISAQKSKSVREFLRAGNMVNWVVFVCARAEENCPAIFPFSFRKLSWPFDDPAAAEGTEEERLAVFRRVRDEIGQKIKEWLEREAR